MRTRPQDSEEHDVSRVWADAGKVLLRRQRLRRSKATHADGRLFWNQRSRVKEDQGDGCKRRKHPALVCFVSTYPSLTAGGLQTNSLFHIYEVLSLAGKSLILEQVVKLRDSVLQSRLNRIVRLSQFHRDCSWSHSGKVGQLNHLPLRRR